MKVQENTRRGSIKNWVGELDDIARVGYGGAMMNATHNGTKAEGRDMATITDGSTVKGKIIETIPGTVIRTGKCKGEAKRKNYGVRNIRDIEVKWDSFSNRLIYAGIATLKGCAVVVSTDDPGLWWSPVRNRFALDTLHRLPLHRDAVAADTDPHTIIGLTLFEDCTDPDGGDGSLTVAVHHLPGHGETRPGGLMFLGLTTALADHIRTVFPHATDLTVLIDGDSSPAFTDPDTVAAGHLMDALTALEMAGVSTDIDKA